MIIAHRMRTVAGADKIVVLSKGTVAEEGAPDVLLSKGGIYSKWYACSLKAKTGLYSRADESISDIIRHKMRLSH